MNIEKNEHFELLDANGETYTCEVVIVRYVSMPSGMNA